MPFAYLLSFCLLAPFGAPDDEPGLAAYAAQSQGRMAMGLYVFGSKVGWLISDDQLEERDGERVFVMRSEMVMRFEFEGEVDESRNRSETVYSLEGDGDLLSYREDDSSEGSHTRIVAELDGDELVIVKQFADRLDERVVPKTADTLRNQQRLDAWLEGEHEPGEQFESAIASFEEEDIDQAQRLTWIGKETVSWAGVPTAIIRVRARIPGMPIPVDVEMLENGTMAWLEIGGLVECRLEDEAVARRLDVSVDMMQATAVPTDVELGDPEQIDELVLRIDGLGDYAVPQAARQRVEVVDGETLVRLGRHDLDDRVALPDDERSSALEATTRYNVDDAVVTVLVEALMAQADGLDEQVRLLADWVSETLDDSYARNAETAVQILENGAGDCTEHACLFVTMARAAGIPAREVGGIVYGGDQQFAWHAWAEVYDGDRWISVDPGWNQVPVDPTHVKLSTGDDVGWVALLGRIEVSVQEHSPLGEGASQR